MESFGIGITHPGHRRENNEDSWYVDNDLGLYIVCDGMGGHAAGEVASQKSIESIANRLREERALFHDVQAGVREPHAVAMLIKRAVEDACAAVHEMAVSEPRCAGMGTTLTLLVVAGPYGIMGHVGDSRLYLYRSAQLEQLSMDHTLVEQMVRAGAMTREEARQSRFAHALTRAVGTQPCVAVDTLVMSLRPGDRLLLCSDGLTEELEHEVIARTIQHNFEEIPDALVERALDHGGRDNVTVIAIQIAQDQEATAIDNASWAWSDTYVSLDALESSFLCVGLPLAQVQRIANICELVKLQQGDRLFRNGHTGDYLAVLVEGRISVTRAGQVLADYGEPGDALGASFLLAECLAGADAHAAENARVLRLDRARFQVFCKRRPWLGVELLTRLGRFNTSALAHARQDAAALAPVEWL